MKHPYLRGLIDGTLPEERFRYYVLQSTFSVCKRSALSGKVPLISALPSGCYADAHQVQQYLYPLPPR
jgi:hypothetical protein